MRKDSSEKKNYIAAISAMTALCLLLSLITGAESAYAIVEEASEELTIGGVPVVVQWDNLLLTAIAIFFVVLFTMQRKKAIKASLSDHSLEMGNITFFKQRLEKELVKGNAEAYYIYYIGFENGYVRRFCGTEDFMLWMQHLATVITDNVKTAEGDFSARVSDGSFAAAVKCDCEQSAEEWIEKVLELAADFEGAMFIGAKPRIYGGMCRAGVEGIGTETLLYTAQQFFIHAEEEGRHYVCGDSDIARKHEEHRLIAKDAVAAIKRGEFKIYMQPVVTADGGAFAGAEALTRWDHPQRGLLMPGSYVEALADVGIIGELDYYVFEQVCAFLEKWEKTSLKNMHLSCNFTRLIIGNKDFADRVIQIANRYKFERKRAIIEITEDTMIRSAKTAMRNITELREAGFRFSLDDFGSGCTSFADMMEYPFSLIKVDRNIVMSGVTESKRRIIKDLITMCHDMGKAVICEGVETEEQLEMVKLAGGDFVQGFYFYKPMPAEEAERIMKGTLPQLCDEHGFI